MCSGWIDCGIVALDTLKKSIDDQLPVASMNFQRPILPIAVQMQTRLGIHAQITFE